MRKDKTAERCLINALRLFSNGKDEEAKKEVSKAIKQDSSLYEGYQLLGWIHLTQNSYKVAEEYFSTAESLVYKKAKNMRLDKAVDIYQRGLVGNLVFLHFAAGMHSWMGNQFDEAETSFRKAIKCADTLDGFVEFLEKIIALVRVNRKFVGLFEMDNLLVFRETLSEILPVLDKVKEIERTKTGLKTEFPAIIETIQGKGVCISFIAVFLQIIFLIAKFAENQENKADFLDKIGERINAFDWKDEILLPYKKFAVEFVNAFKAYDSLKLIPKEEQKRLVKILLPLLDVYDVWSKLLPDNKARKLIEDRIKGLYDKMQSLPDLIQREAKKAAQKALASKEQTQGAEKAEYEIWLPNSEGEGCNFESISKTVLNKKIKNLRNKYTLLIDDRYQSIYFKGQKIEQVRISRKDKKTGRTKYVAVKIKAAKYNLMLWFLLHKDERFSYERVYRRGWSHKWENIVPDKYLDTLKNEISELNAVFESLHLSLKIETERQLGYRCIGESDFCLILKVKSKQTLTSHDVLAQVPENHT